MAILNVRKKLTLVILTWKLNVTIQELKLISTQDITVKLKKINVQQDIGPARIGDTMKLFEIDAELSKKIPWDLVEDALVYMRNEPMFYRKEYYPIMTQIADSHRAGNDKKIKEMIMPLINKGILSYCKKYNLASMPDDIFSEDHRNKMYEKIFQEEMDQIKKGEYQ